MGCVFPGSIGELFGTYRVIGYSDLRKGCREVHVRHTGYAATFGDRVVLLDCTPD